MDRILTSHSRRGNTASMVPPSSPTALAQETERTLYPRDRFTPQTDSFYHQYTPVGRNHLAYGASAVDTPKSDTAMDPLSSFPCTNERPPQNWTSSPYPECDQVDDSDKAPVSLERSLRYGLLLFLAVLSALATGIVLAQNAPGSAVTSLDTGGPGAALYDEVLRPSLRSPNRPGTDRALRADLLLPAPAVVDQAMAAGDANVQEVPGQSFEDGPEPRMGAARPAGGKVLMHPNCGRVFYTYCRSPMREFFFDRTANECGRATAASRVEVCNRGPNRFATRTGCERSCVDARRPSSMCMERPVFSKCGSADFRRYLWFFDGKACRPWDFSSGRCPIGNASHFMSHEACVRKCSSDEKQQSLCQNPAPGVCSGPQLRFPYFAIKLPGEKTRCVSTWAPSLRDHLCLTGYNRFETIASCKRACTQ